MKISTWYSTR